MNDSLNQVLFGDENRELVNIKFSKGSAEVSEVEFREAAAKLVFEVQNELTNSRKEFGDKGRHQVNVEELIKAL